MGDFLARFRDQSGRDNQQSAKICKTCLARQAYGSTCRRCGGKLLEPLSSDDPFLGTVVGEKYRLVEKLGAGGMGVVYRGVNESLGQNVAVKFLHSKFASDTDVISRFITEAKSYARVSHPNAVTLLEYGQHNENLYIITEFIDGESLSDVLRRNGPLSVVDCLHVALQICEVLSVAHAQGVIHRDLKPDNIMLKRNSRGRYVAKVLDFGIAKIADDEQGPVTQTGLVFGTPEFMSPEQARGWDAEPRSDLYALGIILYYAVTGRLPFRGKNKLGILNKQINDQPVALSRVKTGLTFSQPFEQVVERLLAKKPQDRFDSADQLAEHLEQVLAYESNDSMSLSVRLIESKPHLPYVAAHEDSPYTNDIFKHEPEVMCDSVDGDSSIDFDAIESHASGVKCPTVVLGESSVIQAVDPRLLEDEETLEAPRSLVEELKEEAFDFDRVEIRSPRQATAAELNAPLELHREFPFMREAKRRRERRRMVYALAAVLLAVSGSIFVFYFSNGEKDSLSLNSDSLARLDKAKNAYVVPFNEGKSKKKEEDREVKGDRVVQEETKSEPTKVAANNVVNKEVTEQKGVHDKITESLKQQVAMIRDLVHAGDLSGAQKNLTTFTQQTAKEWGEKEKEVVEQLRQDLVNLRTWKIQASEAVDARRCSRAESLRLQMKPFSPAIADSLVEPIKKCMTEPSKKEIPQAVAEKRVEAVAPKKEVVVPKKVEVVPPKKEVVAQAAKPEPKSVSKPATKSEAPPVKVAAAEKPQVAKQAVKKDVAKEQAAKKEEVVAKREEPKKLTLPPMETIALPKGVPEDDFFPSVSELLENQSAALTPPSLPAFQAEQQSSIRPVEKLPSKKKEDDDEKKKNSSKALPPKKI